MNYQHLLKKINERQCKIRLMRQALHKEEERLFKLREKINKKYEKK